MGRPVGPTSARSSFADRTAADAGSESSVPADALTPGKYFCRGSGPHSKC